MSMCEWVQNELTTINHLKGNKFNDMALRKIFNGNINSQGQYCHEHIFSELRVCLSVTARVTLLFGVAIGVAKNKMRLKNIDAWKCKHNYVVCHTRDFINVQLQPTFVTF